MATVDGLGGVVSGDVPAALVALVAYRPVAAVGLLQVVAAVIGQVPDHELAVLVQVAEKVLGLRVLLEAVPVAAAVVGVRVPASPQLPAVYLLVLGGAVGGQGGGRLAVVVTLIADRSPVTLDVVPVVAAIVDCAVHLRIALLVIRTQNVLRAATLDAVPVLAAVVGVRVVSRS